MSHDIYSLLPGAVLFYYLGQSGIFDNPRWIERRYLCPDTNNTDMFNVPKFQDNILKLRWFKCEWVPSRQKHIGNLVMLLYVLYRRRKVSQIFVLRVDEDALTETVPADSVTHITNQRKDRGRIFMLEPRASRNRFSHPTDQAGPIHQAPAGWG